MYGVVGAVHGRYGKSGKGLREHAVLCAVRWSYCPQRQWQSRLHRPQQCRPQLMHTEWQLSKGTELWIRNDMGRCAYTMVGGLHGRYGASGKGLREFGVQSGGAIQLFHGSTAKLSSCVLSGNSAVVLSCGLRTAWNDVCTAWLVLCITDTGHLGRGQGGLAVCCAVRWSHPALSRQQYQAQLMHAEWQPGDSRGTNEMCAHGWCCAWLIWETGSRSMLSSVQAGGAIFSYAIVELSSSTLSGNQAYAVSLGEVPGRPVCRIAGTREQADWVVFFLVYHTLLRLFWVPFINLALCKFQ